MEFGVCPENDNENFLNIYLNHKNKHDTLLAGPEGSFSCQGDSWDGSTEGQHFSHVIAAGMGAEWIHRYFAKDDVADFKVVNV